MPDAVLVSEAVAMTMRDILLASTRSGREVSGLCSYRDATDAERRESMLPVGDAWVLEDFRTTREGDASHVALAPAGPGELSWHTHPGLRFSMAGFSEGDERAVAGTGRPLLVIGYTFAAPDTLSWLMVVGGWQGVALAALVQATLRAEAAGKLDPRLSRVGIAARMLSPDGTLLPVRRLSAAPWRRVIETGVFEFDRVVSASAITANRWVGAAWKRMRSGLEG